MNSINKTAIMFFCQIILVFSGFLVVQTRAADEPPTELYVRTTPEGAKVFLDGNEVGVTPGLFKVDPGAAKIVVKLEGHDPIEKEVKIKASRVTRIELALKKQAEDAGEQTSQRLAWPSKATSQSERQRYFVRLVVDKDDMTFEGQKTNWEDLSALLEKVPNRGQTVLEIAVASDQLTLKQQQDGVTQAGAIAKRLGFEYSSQIGVHPLGSKGPPAQTINVDTILTRTQNILKNPGIEAGDKAPDDWDQGAEIEGVKYSWDKEVAFAGKASLCIEKTAQTYFPIAQWSQTVDREGEKSVLFVSAQVKAKNMTKGYIDVIFLDENDNWIKHTWVTVIGSKQGGKSPANHDWKKYSGKVSIPPKTKKLCIALQVYGPGKVWFDDVRASYEQPVGERGAAKTSSEKDLPNATVTETTQTATGKDLGTDLQGLISKAKPRAVVTIPPGVYRGPITIDRPLTLKGENPEKCVLELTADEPALMVSSKGPVIVDSISIKWQLAKSERQEDLACALAMKDGNVTIRNCRVTALGNFMRCPSAVQCLGFSKVKLENCRFEGFDFSINYTGGAEGSITDCMILNPGHCGITVYSSSKIDVARNIITGSGYHGLRCTGGTLLAHDNLIIKNKNRGIYLGNKPASGKVSNNVIMSNATGISAFGQSDVTIENNLILNSSYAGLDTRDSCPLIVRNNVFQENSKGVVLFAETGRNQVTFGQNSFWKNTTDTENVDMPKNSILVDPRFEDPEGGNFTLQEEELKTNKQGLLDPSVIRNLWKKWDALSQEK